LTAGRATYSADTIVSACVLLLLLLLLRLLQVHAGGQHCWLGGF
jgi:hypothetical protein